VPIEAKRIFRPPVAVCAASTTGSNSVDFTAAPTTAAPAPRRTKSRLVMQYDSFMIPSRADHSLSPARIVSNPKQKSACR
jgi:hypothetical protein